MSFVLQWPIYTSVNIFTGCFLLNNIVQYILVCWPSLIPESWDDKFVAWGAASIVCSFFISASAAMHYIGIVPPSYHSMRGEPHDLLEHKAILLRRWVVIISFSIIFILRIKISVNLRRTCYLLRKKLRWLYGCCCDHKANDNVDVDDSVSYNPILDDESKIIALPSSNPVLSNGTLFIWSAIWFVVMALRRTFGDENLIFGDIAVIAIVYFYPILIVFTHSNIKRFLKRRMIFAYNRSIQDAFCCMLVLRCCGVIGCLRETRREKKEPSTTENVVNPYQWAIRVREADVESIQINDAFNIDGEAISSTEMESNECSPIEPVE